MNLHKIVTGVISAVNPQIVGTFQASSGNITGGSGKRTPSYAPPINVYMQVQPLSTGDIMKLDGLNLQGVMSKIYMNGRVDGAVRPEVKGGDLFTITSGVNKGVWLVNNVLEQWPDWACCAVTLQNGK